MSSSVLVAIDGPSKAGSTFLMSHIAEGAEFQKAHHSRQLDVMATIPGVQPETLEGVDVLRSLMFNRISTLSAGNFFRVGALAVILRQLDGLPLTNFNEPGTADGLKQLLAIHGIEEELQTNPAIGRNVSPMSKRVPGAIAVCETVFCEAVSAAYHADGGGNLVVADGRNPLSIFERRGLLGSGEGQIDPAGIIPVYVDTKPEHAAVWLGGDYDAKLAEIIARRDTDASRPEHPVEVPSGMDGDLGHWAGQFIPGRADNSLPTVFQFRNGPGVDVMRMGDNIATLALDLHASLYNAENAAMADR